jgi:hypothetical protein
MHPCFTHPYHFYVQSACNFCVDWLCTPHIKYSQKITNFNILYLGEKSHGNQNPFSMHIFYIYAHNPQKKITNLKGGRSKEKRARKETKNGTREH